MLSEDSILGALDRRSAAASHCSQCGRVPGDSDESNRCEGELLAPVFQGRMELTSIVSADDTDTVPGGLLSGNAILALSERPVDVTITTVSVGFIVVVLVVRTSTDSAADVSTNADSLPELLSEGILNCPLISSTVGSSPHTAPLRNVDHRRLPVCTDL